MIDMTEDEEGHKRDRCTIKNEHIEIWLSSGYVLLFLYVFKMHAATINIIDYNCKEKYNQTITMVEKQQRRS